MSFKYWAFISYSHHDKDVAEWLHTALETYRVPRRLIGRPSRDGSVPGRLYPVFRDREELPSSSNLGDDLTRALGQSRYLIVVCSPRAARSRWVNEEIITYKRLGYENRILCLIVDGEPNATDRPEGAAAECLPEVLRHRVDRDGQLSSEHVDPMAADLRQHADGRVDAQIKCIAGLLGIGFDELKQRERQRVRRRRIIKAVQVAVALTVVVLTYIITADGGISMPGGAPIRTLIDRHEASLLRPVHQDTYVARDAAEVAREMTRQILDKKAQGQLRRASGNYDLWSTAQVLTPVLRSTYTGAEDRRRAVALLGEAFDNEKGIEANGVKFGWPSQNANYSQAESTLWMIAALSAALGRPGAIPEGERGRYERMLGYSIETTSVFYPIDDGGWNMFPQQVEADLHSDYSSAVALLALLELREAGIELPTSAARRDELIGKTAEWLIKSHIADPTYPGWAGNRTNKGTPLEGLTLQVYSTLMRARTEASILIPDSYFDEVFSYLARMNNRPFSPDHISIVFTLPFVPHTGRREDSYYPNRFLWYPWAITCATQWLTHACNAGVDREQVTQVRRVLGVDVQLVLKVTILTWCKINHFAW
jgi:hypothetical protein